MDINSCKFISVDSTEDDIVLYFNLNEINYWFEKNKRKLTIWLDWLLTVNQAKTSLG